MPTKKIVDDIICIVICLFIAYIGYLWTGKDGYLSYADSYLPYVVGFISGWLFFEYLKKLVRDIKRRVK